MRERSHKKGEQYQQDVKQWLLRSGFLRLEAAPFGDAYDVTKRACSLGGIAYDFSLKLHRGNVARRILYGECKYRDERRGAGDREFREFLKRVCRSVKTAEADDADNAVFVFLTNVPPESWREYLRDKPRFLKKRFEGETDLPPNALLAALAERIHILVLSGSVIERIP
jgi:hypothetical protein